MNKLSSQKRIEIEKKNRIASYRKLKLRRYSGIKYYISFLFQCSENTVSAKKTIWFSFTYQISFLAICFLYGLSICK